ncbi:MAG: hypothetical protein ACU84H_02990 [Gammaproteobacteria bacterium]
MKSDLILPWLIVGLMLAMLAVYVAVCHLIGEQLQQPLPEQRRELIRSVLYAAAIISFPATNLIRHIMVRLNQTMPGDSPPKRRYLTTVIISMALMEVIGIFGFIMFLLGDNFNTLYIFTGMSALGAFLYRPKPDEYFGIVEALAAKADE